MSTNIPIPAQFWSAWNNAFDTIPMVDTPIPGRGTIRRTPAGTLIYVEGGRQLEISRNTDPQFVALNFPLMAASWEADYGLVFSADKPGTGVPNINPKTLPTISGVQLPGFLSNMAPVQLLSLGVGALALFVRLGRK